VQRQDRTEAQVDESNAPGTFRSRFTARAISLPRKAACLPRCDVHWRKVRRNYVELANDWCGDRVSRAVGDCNCRRHLARATRNSCAKETVADGIILPLAKRVIRYFSFPRSLAMKSQGGISYSNAAVAACPKHLLQFRSRSAIRRLPHRSITRSGDSSCVRTFFS